MAEQLKNMYTEEFVKNLAVELNKADQKFESSKFIKSILNGDWHNRELKARTIHISEQMNAFLPYAYKEQMNILALVAPKFVGFTAMIFPTFIELYGLDDFETSLIYIENFTQYSSSEFAIRPYLDKKPETIKTLYNWSKSNNYHVRRLASEGCRPLLPWAMKLHQYVKDPTPILPILEELRNDPEDYVYRSVANNLNDISKNHPDLVLELCSKWINETKTTKWVAKHALRTLLKKGNQRAMLLFGFGSIKSIKPETFQLDDIQIKVGDFTQLKVGIKNTGPTSKFRLEYAIGYLKKNGAHNEKVFQLRETEVKNGESLTFSKKLDFKDLSTRKHYKGDHYVILKVNGNPVKRAEFVLE